MTEAKELVCQICGRHGPRSEMIVAGLIRPAVVEVIRRDFPGWTPEGYICEDDLNRFRYQYVSDLVEEEKGELTDLDREVLESMARHEILSTQVDREFDLQLTFGQRLSDRIAQLGGSWQFIIFFAVILTLWIVLNTASLLAKPFDPYPYILMNLILSCLAAVQAPIIMMSQNRQEEIDRSRAAHDYQVNLKAELEIRQVHQKLDHLLTNQWERLVEIQKVQLELLSEVRSARPHPEKARNAAPPAAPVTDQKTS